MAKKPVSPKSSGVRKSEDAVTAPGRQRSPNYPSISLPHAVDCVRTLVDKDGKAGAQAEIAVKHLGFSGLHGAARSMLSALKKFALIDYADGRVVPTEDALVIVRFPDGHPRKQQALRRAVLSPTIYAKIAERYAPLGELPSDESLKPELITDWDFSPKAVASFLGDFKSSLSYAGMLDGTRLSVDDADFPPEGARSASEPATAETESRLPSLTQGGPASWTPLMKPPMPPPHARTEPRPEVFGGPTIRFDLPRGNVIEIRMKTKVTPAEFQQIKRIFDLSEVAFVEEPRAMISMMMGRNLTAQEQDRLNRLDGPLSAAFSAAGRAVRVCEAQVDGGRRMIKFIEGLIGASIASISADDFLNMPDEAVISQLAGQVR